jgi:capsular polysaccharide biosynthesis protein
VSGDTPATTEVLRDVFVNDDGLIFRRGRVLPQSFVHPFYGAHYRRPSGYGRFLAKNYLLRRGASAAGSCLWVTDNFSPGSYHHWLIDSLPRLLEAEALRPVEDVVLLPGSVAREPYVTFTLRAFPRLRRVGRVGPRAKVRVDRLTVIPRPGEYRPDALAEVARRVGDLAGEPEGERRIYLSRASASRRRASNERDVRGVLHGYGFSSVEIDPADPAQQVRVCRGAELIVGVHGAALSNLIFMPPGGRLIELRRPETPGPFFFDHYRWLARATGIGYRALECEVANPVGGAEINNADLVVDLDALRESLDADAWPDTPAPMTVPVGFGARPDLGDMP